MGLISDAEIFFTTEDTEVTEERLNIIIDHCYATTVTLNIGTLMKISYKHPYPKFKTELQHGSQMPIKNILKGFLCDLRVLCG